MVLGNNSHLKVFSEHNVEGFYRRLSQYSNTGSTSPCPQAIHYFNRGYAATDTTGNWLIPHESIRQNEIVCDDGRLFRFQIFNKTSLSPPALDNVTIAQETFDLMKQYSLGFLMGIDYRECGQWNFPLPSVVFFL